MPAPNLRNHRTQKRMPCRLPSVIDHPIYCIVSLQRAAVSSRNTVLASSVCFLGVNASKLALLLEEPSVKHALLYVAALLFVAGPGLAQQAPAAPAHHSAHAASSVPKPSADKLWDNLMAGNAR